MFYILILCVLALGVTTGTSKLNHFPRHTVSSSKSLSYPDDPPPKPLPYEVYIPDGQCNGQVKKNAADCVDDLVHGVQIAVDEFTSWDFINITSETLEPPAVIYRNSCRGETVVYISRLCRNGYKEGLRLKKVYLPPL